MMNKIVAVVIEKPLSLVQIISFHVVRCMAFATILCWKITNLFFNFNLHFWCQIFTLPLTLIALPLRMINALHHQAQLERLVDEMELQLESLMWEKKEAEQLLDSAIKEREIMEAEFEEIEEEHDRALTRISLLEKELDELKIENSRLNEVQGKSIWNFKLPDEKLLRHMVASEPSSPAWSPSYKNRPLIQTDSWEIVEKGDSLERRRIIALARSLFSAFLSLLVGAIVWKAEDPCAPLVAALFTVVAMSLNSVMDFFTTLRNKPASHAVALLSLNWFILGMLTCPTLPSIARMLAPRVVRFADKAVSWLGSP